MSDQTYARETRVIRPGATPAAGAASAAPPPAPAADASGVVAELKPYLPRIALGGALVLLADLLWAGLKWRRERRRERKRRWRGRR